jgi:hypothetical protein
VIVEFVNDLKSELFGMQFLAFPVEEAAPSLTSYQQFPEFEDLVVDRVSRYSRPATDS